MGFQIMNLIGNWLNSKDLYRLMSGVMKGEGWGLGHCIWAADKVQCVANSENNAL